MAYVNDIHRLEAGSADRLGGIVRRLRERISQYRLYRKTLDELRALSPRELADLGIHETMIGQIAYDAAYSK